jgi:hypothetical protein
MPPFWNTLLSLARLCVLDHPVYKQTYVWISLVRAGRAYAHSYKASNDLAARCWNEFVKSPALCVSSRYADCCKLLPTPRTPVQSLPLTTEHSRGTCRWSCRSDCCDVAGTVPESSSSRCGPTIPKPWIPNARYLSAFPYEAMVSLHHTTRAQDERLLNNRILMCFQATVSTP